MRKLEVLVAQRQKPGEKIRFVALESGVLLLGRATEFDMLHDFCAHTGIDKNKQKTFAAGTCEEGQLIFVDGTPAWKRDEIREYLAGVALELALSIDKNRRANTAEMENFIDQVVGRENVAYFRS